MDAAEATDDFIQQLKRDHQAVLVVGAKRDHWLATVRSLFFRLLNEGLDLPVVVKRDYQALDQEDFVLYSSTDFGGLLVDGFGDGVWLAHNSMLKSDMNRVTFGILQAARVRISKTEYIACPSCGRTLFDLQETTEMIRVHTEHLKGVKIAIMGCIVNGPGEMADADYGYVGSGPGKITLYKGKEIIKRNINSDVAVDQLISLIREDGKWVDKQK